MIENESDLVQQARTGDTEAYDQLCKVYQCLLYDYVFKNVTDGNHDDTEDCVQEVFFRGWIGLKNYQGVDIFPWFKGIARKLKLEIIRKKTKRKEVSFEQVFTDKETDKVFEPASVDPSPENEVIMAINKLELKYRAVLTFKYVDRLNPDEFVRKIKHFADTKDKLKKLLQQAREVLKAELEKREFLDKQIGLE